MAAASDKNVLATLTTTNALLAKQLKAVIDANAKITAANNAVIRVLNKAGIERPSKVEERDCKKRKTNQDDDWFYNPGGYCFTCGCKVKWGHSSFNCHRARNSRIKGHDKEATLKNKKGGSTAYKNWWMQSEFWKGRWPRNE